jgi:hypothetical protein
MNPVSRFLHRVAPVLTAGVFLLVVGGTPEPAAAQGSASGTYEFSDAHFHLTNYIQEGTDIRTYMEIMGTTVARSTLFGIPLQQTWSHANTGDFAPTYYLQTDAPLYYYSFTDAFIAMEYRKLTPAQQARLDPMITGFNPADMYAVDHIKRALLTFPGVFSGIGEFTVHKEFVSAKVAGTQATLTDPALDRILAFAGEAGLVVIFHNDINMPFPKPDQEPYMLKQLRALFSRHPNTTIIWAHVGLGRVVQPVKNQLAMLEHALGDPALKHVYLDISWDEVAKYIVQSTETVAMTAAVINKYPDRFLFGTDVVAPAGPEAQRKVYDMYAPLWKALGKETSDKVRLGNYARLFDAARLKVRAWEKANENLPRVQPAPTPASGSGKEE